MAKKIDDSEDVEEKKIPEGKEPQLTDLPGIGPAVAAKIEAAGIYDLMSLAVMSPATLGDIAGVGPGVARKAIQAARNLLDLGFTDGVEYAKKLGYPVIVKPNSKSQGTGVCLVNNQKDNLIFSVHQTPA